MLAATPVDVAPLECEMRPYMTQLFADAAKTARVKLPLGATLRKCAPPLASQVLTVPDSGGTDMCVFYEFGAGGKGLDVLTTKMRTGVAKSLADKKCPALDYARQGYPGKDYFFLSDNVPLPNAFGVKARVESGGLAFLKQEQAVRKDGRPAADFGTAPLSVLSVSYALTNECRKQAGFFQGRYSACYRAEIYNNKVRGGWTLMVALNKQGEYLLVDSIFDPKAAR